MYFTVVIIFEVLFPPYFSPLKAHKLRVLVLPAADSMSLCGWWEGWSCKSSRERGSGLGWRGF